MRCFAEADAVQHDTGAGTRLPSGQAVEAPDHLDVLPTGQVAIDRGILPGQPDSVAHRLGLAVHVEPGDPHHALIGREQRGEDADQRGLARAVRAEQPVDDPGRDVQAQPVQRPHLTAESLDHALSGDDRLHRDLLPQKVTLRSTSCSQHNLL